MFRNIYALFSLCIFTRTVGNVPLYETTEDVIELTPKNFDKLVLKDKSIWLVQFYAPWCTYCKILQPEYQKAAKNLKGFIKVGAVNAYKYKSLADRYSIKGYPTIKFFAENKRLPINYNGKRNANDIIQAGIYRYQQSK